MTTYTATIRWSRTGEGDFAKGQYSRAHEWAVDGGAVIPASASPHIVPAPWSDPAAGGDGAAQAPQQAARESVEEARQHPVVMPIMRTPVFALSLILLACGKAPTLEESYSGPWGNPTSDVMITLGKNHIAGCGEFYQKASKTSQGEYAVACTHNPAGQLEWNLYLVWPAINEVTGPDPISVWKLGKPPRELTKADL